MAPTATTIQNNNPKKSAEVLQDQGNSKPGVKRRFWERDVAFPSRLVENMQELEKLYQLRYDVYCLQKGFLDPENYPDNCESDVYDQNALHFGAFDDLGNALGTLRLIKNSDMGFPLLDHCEIDVPESVLASAGEISRLAVSKMIRKRVGDGDYGMAAEGGGVDRKSIDSAKDNRRRHRPDIVVGLYKSLYQESKKHGITHWLAVMEPGLLKLLRRFYFDFEPIGPEVDYYGPVRPYMVSLEDIEDKVYQSSKPFYASFVKGLPPELIKHPL